MKETKFIEKARGYALIYGAGAIAALQALKFDLFVFPENAKIILSYFFSFVAIFSVFLGGFSLLEKIQEGSKIITRLNEIKEHEQKKTDEKPTEENQTE